LNAQFNALLVKNKIAQKFHTHYLKWLRYYLDFCQRYRFSESNSQSLPNFIRKFKKSGRSKSQIDNSKRYSAQNKAAQTGGKGESTVPLPQIIMPDLKEYLEEVKALHDNDLDD